MIKACRQTLNVISVTLHLLQESMRTISKKLIFLFFLGTKLLMEILWFSFYVLLKL